MLLKASRRWCRKKSDVDPSPFISMNSSRYIVARFLISFGVGRKNKRLMEAADETHLLYQAEEILGEFVWKQAEDIEKISVEYWSMRKLVMDISELSALIQKTDDVLNTAHQERHEVLSHANEGCQELEVKHAKYLTQADELILERDQTIAEAKGLKRQFEAAMTKVKVLGLEGGNEEVIASDRKKIASYKRGFEVLKKIGMRWGGGFR